jgi:hypothetical protein
MGRNFLKSMVVLAALAVLVLVPVVEATYMLGHPYVGTGSKQFESRRWALSGFYEGRSEMPSRDRELKRYYAGNTQGRAYRTSLLTDGETSYSGVPGLLSGRRCLGCEIGAYSLDQATVRRGRYYFSISQVAGRSKFVYTGGEGYQPLKGGSSMVRRNVASRSRLLMSEDDLAKLHAEMTEDYQLRSGRRCLSCEFEAGKRLGRYYAMSPDVKDARSYVPLE